MWTAKIMSPITCYLVTWSLLSPQNCNDIRYAIALNNHGAFKPTKLTQEITNIKQIMFLWILVDGILWMKFGWALMNETKYYKINRNKQSLEHFGNVWKLGCLALLGKICPQKKKHFKQYWATYNISKHFG